MGAGGQLGNKMRELGSESQRNRYVFTDVAELDITDPEAVNRMMDTQRIGLVVNCAAYTAVERAEDDPHTADLLNRQAVANLAAACRRTDAVLIHISTDYVFQGEGNLPCTEEQPADPLGVYGRTKLAGEQEIARSGCRALIFRTAWLYSEYGNNFVKTMMRLTAEKEEVRVVFDQVGTPTYAGDLAAAIYHIIESGGYDGKEGIYHFSDEGVCSWYDLAHETARLAGTPGRVLPCHSDEFPSKVKRPVFSVLDKTKFKSAFGLEIPYWRDSLARCIENLKSNQA